MVERNLLAKVSILQPRDDGVFLHPLAFLYGQLHDASLHLEAQQTLVGFDVA
ncbi:MAG: hypothetical protein IH793_12485 [Acidobacteria bacterium]|nr:hypothetical protein [Acidobacteriota bacterium]